MDSETIRMWSARYRNWHYYPEYVISNEPGIVGYEDVRMTDVPTVYHLPDDPAWYMSFVGFNGKGYQSFVAKSTDLLHWSNMQLAMGFGNEGDFDYGGRVIGNGALG